jgi:putative ABC transport system permease protein
MIDALRETFQLFARHRLRTSLTAFAVGWGVFVLVVLMGASVGFERSVEWDFRDDATNSLWIWSGQTTMPHAGLPINRSIRFKNDNVDMLRERLRGIEHVAARFYPPGRSAQIRYQDTTTVYDTRAVNPDHVHLERTEILEGRFINDLDLQQKRKVVVIGRAVELELFRGEPGIGKYIEIGGFPFHVVGIFTDAGGQDEEEIIYLPMTTAQLVFLGGDNVSMLMFTMAGEPTAASGVYAEEQARSILGEVHHFNPKDRRAIRVRNNLESYLEIMQVLKLIQGFTWLVGLGTVLAGIVGVANILMVSVRERTREFGLCKALGAPPSRIIATLMQEALILTSSSGLLGMALGIAVIELGQTYLPENDYLRNPEVDVSLALTATAIIVVLGSLAGVIPALRAARIQPVEALRGG